MRCDLCSLGTGISLAGVLRSALPPGVKRIQARNLDLGNTILKHPCVHGDPAGSQEGGTSLSLCYPAVNLETQHVDRDGEGTVEWPEGTSVQGQDGAGRVKGQALPFSYLQAWLCLQASECQQDQLHPA